VAGKIKKKSSSSFLKKIIILLLVVGLLVIAALAAIPDRFVDRSPVAPTVDGLAYLEGDTFNVALLGFDRSAARESQYSLFRPDTIMIAALNFRSGKVALVSIPRDSYVKIHGTGVYDKINHSYMYGFIRTADDANPHLGGIENVIRTVEDFLGGIAIHDYVIVDMDGAKI
jgi:anionic cell wall polymer biosynthesis LytR-Cps2A-Psr (LCP) family protein